MGTRNKQAGNKLELDVVKKLKELGYDAHTARYANRLLDDSGTDIVTDAPHFIQCKASVNQPNHHKLLTETSCDVVYYRRMEKKGKRFFSSGEYVTMEADKFWNIVKQLKDKV
jgi:hypothetical protein